MTRYFAYALLLVMVVTVPCLADDFYVDEEKVNGSSADEFVVVGSNVVDEGKAQAISMSDNVYKPDEVIKKLGFATGTGFFVDNQGHLITNHHVVDDAVAVSVKMYDGSIRKVDVLATDKANDIALLKVADTRVASPLPLLKNSATEVGQEIMALGYPMIMLQGQNQKATFGRINSKYGIQDDVRFFQMDVPIQPGNSGGPILTKTGAVIGVATMTLSSVGTMKQTGALPQNINYGVKIDYALPMLDQFKVEYQFASSRSEQDFPEVTKQVTDSVALVIAKGREDKK